MLQHLLNSDGWKVLFFFAHDFLARVARNWACSNVRSPRPSDLGLRSLDFFSAGALIGGRDVDADLMAGWLVDLNRGA